MPEFQPGDPVRLIATGETYTVVSIVFGVYLLAPVNKDGIGGWYRAKLEELETAADALRRAITEETRGRIAELIHEVRWFGQPQIAADLEAALGELGIKLPVYHPGLRAYQRHGRMDRTVATGVDRV